MTRSFLLAFFLLAANSFSQPIATFELTLPRPTSGLEIPVSVDLDDVTFVSDSLLALVEVQGKKRVPVPFQIEQTEHRTIHWLARAGKENQKNIVFELINGIPEKHTSINTSVGDSALIVHSGNQNLIRYNHATVYPPAGIDTAYKRSGFIHPLWSPHGQVLTRIQPPDHYHHYGIWNPWTHVLFKGDTVDFWNIRDRKGTVRFANFASVTDGAVFSEFQALHEHVVMKKNGSEEVALNELQSIRIYRPEKKQDYYIADFTFQMNCAAASPVLLLEYRYGGFGWRTTEQWNKENSEVITSEGKARKDADGSTARWCIVQGAVDNDYAGVVMMSYPSNYNHPEPLRIWPENQYNRGDMFANFSPTKNKDWLLEPGKKYTLKYRLLVFNGKFTNDKAENAWQYFAGSPKISIKKH